MAKYEMKDAVVNAWQWDGSVTSGRLIQAQFGTAQDMTFYQSLKNDSVAVLQIRDGKSFAFITAAPTDFVVMMSDGVSLQVMKADAFTAQYKPEGDGDTPGAATGGQTAATGTGATSDTQTASTGSGAAPASPAA